MMTGFGPRAAAAHAVHLGKAGGVPDLGDEIAESLDMTRPQPGIAAHRGHAGQGHAQRIGAVFVDQIQRVDDVALRLRHLRALFVAHQAVDIDGVEGHVARHLQLHHHHPRDPEEDDVKAGHQHAAGMEGLELFGLLGPAEGAEGPQPGAEPGVEYVLVLGQGDVACDAVLFAGLGFGARHIDVALLVIPGRDTVAPPQLARDAPVLQITHPREVHVLVVFGHELDVAVFHRLDGRLGQCFHRHEPLIGQQRLDHVTGTIAVGQGVVDRFGLLEQALGLHVGDDGLASGKAVEAGVCRRQASVDVGQRTALDVEGLGGFEDMGGLREDIDQRKTSALADFIVVEVVGRGDLHAARALVHVGVLIGDDGDATADQRQLDELADQRGVALVVGIDRHGAVAEQGLGAGGGDHQMVEAGVGGDTVGQRIAEVPELTLLVAILDLEIGDGGVQRRVPVDQALAAIHQILFIQADEDLLHRLVEALIHGEALAAPVEACAHSTELAGDMAAGLMLPFPHLVDEGLAPQVVARLAFLGGDLALHQHLGGDAGVVGAHLPQSVATLHPPPADQGVHDGVLEGVTHVQAAGDVGWRNHDGEGVALARGREPSVVFPALVPAGFDAFGLVGLVHGVLLLAEPGACQARDRGSRMALGLEFDSRRSGSKASRRRAVARVRPAKNGLDYTLIRGGASGADGMTGSVQRIW